MRTLKEIADEIRETRKEMKAKRVRKISCFNGGLTADERRFNQRLFNLETERRTITAYLQAQK